MKTFEETYLILLVIILISGGLLHKDLVPPQTNKRSHINLTLENNPGWGNFFFNHEVNISSKNQNPLYINRSTEAGLSFADIDVCQKYSGAFLSNGQYALRTGTDKGKSLDKENNTSLFTSIRKGRNRKPQSITPRTETLEKFRPLNAHIRNWHPDSGQHTEGMHRHLINCRDSQELAAVPVNTLQLSISKTFSVPLGKFHPFWRSQPVLGPYLQDGIWLNTVPGYFFDTDFPYKKRPFKQEVLFADHLSVVRLLGGTNTYHGAGRSNIKDSVSIKKLSESDFVYRKVDGALGFRPQLIYQRLKRYLDNGYDSFTIVLDNVPWCLTKNPIIGPYGQTAPPDKPEEWYATVRELCKTLQNILGTKKANGLRFRIGTEMNGKERFAGTEDEFITHFDYAAAAIKDVLPEARLSLYNISSASIKNIKTRHNVNAFNVINHSSSGINRKSGEPNVAVPFIAVSRYYSEKDDLHTIVSGIDKVWNFIKDSIPGNKNFTREIHEYGASADWDANPKTGNPDAFGNAMNLQMIINLSSNKIDRLFHWNMLESIAFAGQRLMIPNSQLWGYSILDYMAGGYAYKIVPESPNADNQTTHSALLSVFKDKAYLLVNAFNSNRNSHMKYSVILKLPKKDIQFQISSLKSATLNNSNSIYYHIRKDVEEKGLINPMLVGKPEYISNFKNMALNTNQGYRLIGQNWDKYMSLWKTSLTLRAFNSPFEEDTDFYIFRLDLTAPESTVIVLTAKPN